MTQQHHVFDLEQVKNYIGSSSSETKIYLGSDSERFRKDGVWHARYTTVVVVHIDGCHGCRIFGKSEVERDFDAKKDKPSMRLMNEVYKVSQMFIDLQEVLEDRYVEVHIDINGQKEHGSNVVMSQAIGYVKGMTGLTPKIKPEAFAASYAADRGPRIWEDERKAA